ncbi:MULTISPECIES: cyanophycin synthetase [Hydrogenophaga]|jgi:cyanophycin synthetase|uniref:Cyanophycin synthetase n=1 Tax=Hydrogenophaga intermedia TaxID=65786 RepID=A0A1L1PDN2_HYDIT|nr:MULTISPECIES: cyanophycin synthetase [Hydrogenophaga]AOS78182.1 cyanophycin synthetase [Hydrogenophaga sp. PBC]TMU76378.1 cyanophycin synthetase [Hydrogenophaga intermedia]CDN87610.1 Cyanophycin synthetase [Hydrogenophaga intermedia]
MNPIRFLRVSYLGGPNIWTYRPVLESWIDIGELEDHPSHLLPGLYQRLTAWLPGLIEHHCGVGERGGFLQRLQEGTWAGHILEHVVIELLNLAGLQTGFGQTRSTPQRGVYKMVFRARDEQVARRALTLGHELLMAAINDGAFDVDTAVHELRELVDDLCLGPSTASIVDAATGRRIPHIRLNDGNLVQLGYGARQRRIWTAETDRTSAIAESIASDKDLSKGLLAACGVPVPEGQVVESAQAAWAAAQDIGLPVVVKPTDANHGRGVSLELMRQEDVEAAFAVADAEGSGVMVERFVRGLEHRLLVVGGRVVAATRGDEAWVTGDGRSTVLQLIESQINSDPRRGLNEDFPLNAIRLEEYPAMAVELQRQGHAIDSVPAAGQRVLIMRNGNLAIDCTDDVHPQVAHLVALAARVIGLDIAGVDLVAQDISRPLAEQGGAIVEVNAGPGLLMHLKPAVGQPRPVGRAIVDHLFVPGDTGRVPVVGVAGSRGTTAIARLVAWLATLNGPQVGLACKAGLFLGRRPLQYGDFSKANAARRLLMNRGVQTAVFENDPLTIVTEGLAYDRCQVGVVTDASGSPELAACHIREVEQLFKVMRTQVDVVLPDGVAVLNAADPVVAEMAPLCDGDVIFYAEDPDLPVLVEHLAQYRRAVFLRQGEIVLSDGQQEHVVVALSDVSLGDSVAADDKTAVLLASLAAAWALEISPALMAAGLRTFDREAPIAHAPIRRMPAAVVSPESLAEKSL